MKILFLNIFEGCKDKIRFKKIINYIKNENPELLLLSELNLWDEEYFLKIKKKLGFKYSIFSKSNTEYNLGTFSNLTIKKNEIIKEGIHHSLIKFKSNDINYYFTHLSPVSEEERLKEIEIVLNKININDKIMIIGDLNSLSPKDNYNEKEHLKKFKQINLSKFGTEKLKYDLQNKLINFGLIDTFKEFSNEFEYSVPSEFNIDPSHATKLRLDYAYITPSLRQYLKSSKIINTVETNQLSDHFPIIIEFDFNK